MLGTYFTLPELLLWIPLIGGIACFFFKGQKAVRSVAFLTGLATLAVSLVSLYYSDVVKYPTYNAVNYVWLKQIGSSLFLGLDNTGHLLTFLTALTFPIIVLAVRNNEYKSPGAFFGLLLLTQAGLMGVFVAMDGLFFYFCWELALIPVYFLCSKWGGERRIPVTFKFFVEAKRIVTICQTCFNRIFKIW